MAFGFLKKLFQNGLSGAYNSAKSVLGKIYSPINDAIQTVGNFANKVDSVVNDLRNGNIPVISQVARLVKDNPIYSDIMTGVNAVQDVNKTVQDVGNAVDAIAQPALGAIDRAVFTK